MKQTMEERFNENRPKDDEELDLRGESKNYYFGYKHQVGNTIHEVTDWGNILTFIKDELALRDQELLEKLEGMRKNTNYPDEKRYNEARRQEYGFNLALTDVSEVVSGR